jgi:hypothetical protein
MILKHVQIMFDVTNVLLVFFKGSSRISFLFNLWHHTLNQHIHMDTMYLSSITHFNTMIFIPLCENCKLCTYWYHLLRVFIFWLQYLYCHGLQISKKSNTYTKRVCYKSNTSPTLVRSQFWMQRTSMWPCTINLSDEKWKHARLAQQIGFEQAFLHTLPRLVKGTVKCNTCQRRRV